MSDEQEEIQLQNSQIKEEEETTVEENFIIRCRGLPWSTTVEEIVNFFDQCQLKDGENSIHICVNREGRPSGEAYVELESKEDQERALEKDKEHMGKRYVEVFTASLSEMQWSLERKNRDGDGEESENDHVVKLRGLPFECNRDDVSKFFSGLSITSNGIFMTSDHQGRSSGEAFVQFKNKVDVDRALEKNKQSIGRRYIEVFRSSEAEANRAMAQEMYQRNSRDMGPPMNRRPSPYDRFLGRGYGLGGPPGGPPGRSRNFKSFSNNFSGDFNSYDGPGPMNYGGYGGGGGPNYGPANANLHEVRMRGLPYRISEVDIAEWFSSVADPVMINILSNRDGKASGDAVVYFTTEAEARKAMTKDRQNMQHRYVELFYAGCGGTNDGGFGGGRF